MLPTSKSGIEQGRTNYVIDSLYSRSSEAVNGRGFSAVAQFRYTGVLEPTNSNVSSWAEVRPPQRTNRSRRTPIQP